MVRLTDQIFDLAPDLPAGLFQRASALVSAYRYQAGHGSNHAGNEN